MGRRCDHVANLLEPMIRRVAFWVWSAGLQFLMTLASSLYDQGFASIDERHKEITQVHTLSVFLTIMDHYCESERKLYV